MIRAKRRRKGCKERGEEAERQERRRGNWKLEISNLK
jgi:hypothetical protein